MIKIWIQCDVSIHVIYLFLVFYCYFLGDSHFATQDGQEIIVLAICLTLECPCMHPAVQIIGDHLLYQVAHSGDPNSDHQVYMTSAFSIGSHPQLLKAFKRLCHLNYVERCYYDRFSSFIVDNIQLKFLHM